MIKSLFKLMLLCAVFSTLSLHASRIPVEISAEGENRFEDGMAFASGNVVILYGDDVIYCDEAVFDQRRREITARGNVSIYASDTIYRGEHLIYRLETQQVESLDFRGTLGPLLIEAAKVESPKPGHYVMTDGMFTTENREDPAYRIKAGTLEIHPDNWVVMRNVSIFMGPVPVFWFPYLAVPMDDKDNIDFSVGSSSRLGFYGLASYTTALDKRWSTTVHGGYRSRRGFGGGVDLNFNPRPGDRGEFKSFVTEDRNPSIGMDSLDRAGFRTPEDLRYRASYQHRYALGEGLSTTADINVLSDRFIVEDFFQSEFRRERQPDNFFDVMFYDPNFTVTALTRLQVNHLYDTIERKPEVSLEFKRQDLFGLPISYEGESSVVNFKRTFDQDSPMAGGDYAAVRYDTFHQLLYPRQYFGWLSLTPRAGIRGTMYTKNNDPLTNADPGAEVGRLVFNAGLEASFKVSKTWADVQNPHWGIDGLRHILQPYADFAYIPKPNRTAENFRGFDNRIPNTRLQPIFFPSYNSIDSIGEMTAIRHGLRNKLATKRDGENVNLVDWNLYGQANINRSREMGILVDTVYSHVYNEIEVNPLPWLRYEHFSAFGVASDSFNQVDHSVHWQLHPALELIFSHQYLDGLDYRDPIWPNGGITLENGNRLGLGSFWRLNENWQFSHNWQFEADDGKLIEQRYEIFRDMRAWVMSMGAAYRDNRSTSDELLVFMTLTLKAFPVATLNFEN